MARWLVAFLSVVGIVTADYEPNWASLDARPLPSWYDEAKFGIFLHWGVYSVPSFGTEWFWDRWQGKKEKEFVDFMTENYPPGFSYPEFAPMFHAELFDPVAWAKLFSEAGAKYVVLTSKHHEGFTNWPSKYSWNWNSMDTGPHRDLVGDLAAAIRNNTDIHFGLYYSLFEWFHPLYLKDKANKFTTQEYVSDVMLPQLYEIVNGYHPEVIWSDGDWGANDTYWNSTEFLAWLYNESPVKDTVVVNDRWGSGDHCTHGGYFTCHDRFNPGKLYNHKYENAMTVQRTSWGYIRNTNISGYLSIEELLNQLVGTVSTGGNMLMNVGPNHDGRIMPIFEERLLQMGSWLKINGEAIYGSKPWKHQNDSINKDAWYTVDSTGKVVYAIFLTWPDNFILQLGDVMATNQTMATLLGYTGSIKISWQDGSEGINATLPYLPPNTPLQWAWTLKLESAMARPPLDNWNRKQQNVLK
ncbi:alpha-L-fucosidase-like [Dysidea avara]|uniref:alpha-L-fucosidase-like n=1 Tax=Dysidea avara TaxID=196820 RepID=UPI003318960C